MLLKQYDEMKAWRLEIDTVEWDVMQTLMVFALWILLMKLGTWEVELHFKFISVSNRIVGRISRTPRVLSHRAERRALSCPVSQAHDGTLDRPKAI